jgi:hypothetical protein
MNSRACSNVICFAQVPLVAGGHARLGVLPEATLGEFGLTLAERRQAAGTHEVCRNLVAVGVVVLETSEAPSPLVGLPRGDDQLAEVKRPVECGRGHEDRLDGRNSGRGHVSHRHC